MPSGLVSPPNDDNPITIGGGSSSNGGTDTKKKVIIGGAALGGLLLIYLYAKSRSSSSTSAATTASAPMLVAPASNMDTAVGSLASSLQTQLANTNQLLNQNNKPPVIPGQWPNIITYPNYSPGQFTQIGSVNNGVYSGTGVSGGVPMYANVFGGFTKNFTMSTLPQGTGIYIPSVFTPYETVS